MQQTTYIEPVYKDSASARIPNPQFLEPALVQNTQAPTFAHPITALDPALSARSAPSRPQIICLMAVGLAVTWMTISWPSLVMSVVYGLMWTAFMANALLRLATTRFPQQAATAVETMPEDMLPRYSVIVALYKEAKLVPQIVTAMSALDYPADRLDILFALEGDDMDTIECFRAQDLPGHMQIVLVPPGEPRTKPRALNYALTQCHGDHIVIYDAEDRPHPLQLREAALTFATGEANLACLQAPLRPTGGQGFIARQFAAEYAVQFDVLLPAMHALGLPFPLGGTSNHFKAEVLRAIGAWDAWNVTEDADLGLRLAQYGYLTRLITCPTIETPPTDVHTWLPQRTRWIKGYVQTACVHTRLNTRFQSRVWLGATLGIGIGLAAALCYAPLTALMVLALLMTVVETASGQVPDLIEWRDLVLFLTGSLSGMIGLVVGAKRARLRLRLIDVIGAPAYWCLQTLAAGFALYQLVVKPFHWDKTEHVPV